MSVRVVPQHLIVMGVLALVLWVVGLLGAADPVQAAVREEVTVKLNTDLTTIEIINSKYGSTTLDDYFASIGVYLLKPPDGNSAGTFAQELLSESPQNGVVYAERNYVAETPEDPAGDGRMKARAISDLKQGSTNKYAAKYLKLSCAAEISKGKGVTVAVLDTGAQLNHPALRANFSGVRRYDFVDNDTKPSEVLDANGDGKRDPLAGHGTHIAGIVDRVAPAAKIMPLRVLNSRGRGKVHTVAKAVSFAERNETEVVNLSLGSSQRSVLLQDTIGHAIDRGAVVAAAAGNSDAATPHYPAAGNSGAELSLSRPSDAGLLAVSSVVPYVDDAGEPYERKSDFANYGEWVSIAAPGENYEPADSVWYGIRSAFPTDKYANWGGTSMATPFVSGQAALIRSVDPSLEPTDIKKKILASAKRAFRAPPQDADPYDTYAAWNYSHHDPLDPPNQLGPGHVNVCDSLQQ